MKPPVSQADVLRAMLRLHARTAAQKRAIARLLGFSWNAEPPLRRVGADKLEPEEWVSVVTADRSPRQSAPATAPAVQGLRGVTFTIDGPRARERVIPQLAPPLLLAGPDSRAPHAMPEPLFVDRWTRSILSTAFARPTSSHRLDTPVLTQRIARGEALRRVPLLAMLTIAPRLQILVDIGEEMLPFTADQRHVIGEIRRLAGASPLEVLHFAGTPLRRVGTGPRRHWQPYAPLARGTLVILLSGLGLGRSGVAESPSTVDEWLAFADRLDAQDCHAVAFVPYKRRPKALARRIRIVHWDRATTAARVRFGE